MTKQSHQWLSKLQLQLLQAISMQHLNALCFSIYIMTSRFKSKNSYHMALFVAILPPFLIITWLSITDGRAYWAGQAIARPLFCPNRQAIMLALPLFAALK